MSDINRLPTDELSLSDVAQPIRRAVEHIGSQPVPEGNMQRALDRASAIKPIPHGRWFNLRPEIQIRIAVAAAVLIALGVGFWANRFSSQIVTSREPQIGLLTDSWRSQDEDKVTVLVAKRNVQQWTPIRDPWDLFTEEKIARKNAPADFVSGFDQARDRVLIKDLPEGTILAMNSVQNKNQVGLEGTLEPKSRGMAITVDLPSTAGGFVQPGSHIDLLQSNGVTSEARLLLQNVKVRALDTQPRRPENHAAKRSATVT